MNARVSQPAIEEATMQIRRAEDSLCDMRRDVRRYSEMASAAGFGLVAIGDLLGADASEHSVDSDLSHGLANAVVALGALLKHVGEQTWQITEEEQQ